MQLCTSASKGQKPDSTPVTIDLLVCVSPGDSRTRLAERQSWTQNM